MPLLSQEDTVAFHLNYEDLKNLIESRQSFENKQPRHSIHQKLKTTLDFPDFFGYSLVHYATILGKLDELKVLETLGASLTKGTVAEYNSENILQLAFRYGHEHIISYLLKHTKIDIHSVKRSVIDIEGLQLKYDNLIREKLNALTSVHFLERRQVILPFKIQGCSTKSYLHQAVEIGHIAFLTIFFNQRTDKQNLKHEIQTSLTTMENLLSVAIKNKQHAALKVLVNHIDVNMTPISADERDIPTPQEVYFSPLHLAAYLGDWASAEILLSKQANIDLQDDRGFTPIMLAVANGHEDFAKNLLHYSPNLDITNFSKENIFHFCGNSSYELQMLITLSIKNINLCQTPNIYGIQPGDSADLEEYSHNAILIALHYYHTLNYRSLEYLSKTGICNAAGFLYQYYSSRGKRDFFYAMKQGILSWNGTPNELQQELSAPLNEHFKNLGDLFETFSSWINWYQHILSLEENKEDPTHIRQADRELQFEGNINYALKNYTITIPSREHLLEINQILTRLPEQIRIEIGGSAHLTSKSIYQGYFDYYDINIASPLGYYLDAEEVTDLEIDFKLKHTIGLANNFTYILSIYSFDWDNVNFSDYSYFKPEELPNSALESLEFQKNSANSYTHLHIATMMHSLFDVKKLIEMDNVNVNALDIHGMDPLLISAFTCNIEISKTILSSPHIQLSNNQTVIFAYLENRQELVNLIIEHKNSRELNDLSKIVLQHKDYEFAQKLFTLNKVDASHYALYAYELEYFDVVDKLIFDKNTAHQLPDLLMATIKKDDLPFIKKIIENGCATQDHIIDALITNFYLGSHKTTEIHQYLFSSLDQDKIEEFIYRLAEHKKYGEAIAYIEDIFNSQMISLNNTKIITSLFFLAKTIIDDPVMRLFFYETIIKNLLIKYPIALTWKFFAGISDDLKDRGFLLVQFLRTRSFTQEELIDWKNILIEMNEAPQHLNYLQAFMDSNFMNENEPINYFNPRP